jgi:hypothetical protein
MAKKLSPIHPGEILREEFLVRAALPGSSASRAKKSLLRPTPRCGSASFSRPALRSEDVLAPLPPRPSPSRINPHLSTLAVLF